MKIISTFFFSLFLMTLAGKENAKRENGSGSLKRQQRSELKGSNFSGRFGKKPKRKNLDRDYLIQLIGDNYDHDFLSEEEPSVLSEVAPIPQLDQMHSSSSWTMKHTLKELNNLNLTKEILQIRLNDSLQSAELVDVVKQWLFQRAVCPVHYTWLDIGPYFWPRWIKSGECMTSESVCSWPPGMFCTPAETTAVQVLRWHCSGYGYRGRKNRPNLQRPPRPSKNRKGWKKGPDNEKKEKKCQWIKIPYPVTSACLCRC